MYNKNRFLFIFFALFILDFTKISSMNFDDFFKEFNFSNFQKDMEDMEKIESQKEKKQVHPSTTKNGVEEKHSTLSTEISKKISKEPIETDSKKLFLDPINAKQENDSQKDSHSLPSKKTAAYQRYMKSFLDVLKNIEITIDSSKKFSPQFEKEFIKLKRAIDKITVVHGTLSDKEFYLKAFFSSQFNNLRKKIFDILEQLKNIEKEIDIQDEEKAEENIEKELKHQTKKKPATIESNFSQIIQFNNIKRRGTPQTSQKNKKRIIQ
jgi:hypothetical protein